jgi:hypothetical protein
MSNPKKVWFPETPAGTVLVNLKSSTEEGAWQKLLKDAAHMPYKGKQGFINRGYKVKQWEWLK